MPTFIHKARPFRNIKKSAIKKDFNFILLLLFFCLIFYLILRLKQEASELSSEEIKERRRRVHIPTFSNGSIQEAKDWLAEYKSICHHLRFTEREQLDDLQVRFKGTALSWYTYSCRQNWSHVFIFCLYTLWTTSFLSL